MSCALMRSSSPRSSGAPDHLPSITGRIAVPGAFTCQPSSAASVLVCGAKVHVGIHHSILLWACGLSKPPGGKQPQDRKELDQPEQAESAWRFCGAKIEDEYADPDHP